MSGAEVCQALAPFLVDEHHLYLCVAVAQPAVECQALYPHGQVGFGHAPLQHPLEVHYQVKCDAVNVFRIHYN